MTGTYAEQQAALQSKRQEELIKGISEWKASEMKVEQSVWNAFTKEQIENVKK